MSIYCPLSEKLGIESDVSILDISDEYEEFFLYVPGAFTGQKHTEETKQKMRGPRGPNSRTKNRMICDGDFQKSKMA